jgi:hypothetical protein
VNTPIPETLLGPRVTFEQQSILLMFSASFQSIIVRTPLRSMLTFLISTCAGTQMKNGYAFQE